MAHSACQALTTDMFSRVRLKLFYLLLPMDVDEA